MDPNLIELAIKWNHIASYMHFNTNLRFSIRIFSVFATTQDSFYRLELIAILYISANR